MQLEGAQVRDMIVKNFNRKIKTFVSKEAFNIDGFGKKL